MYFHKFGKILQFNMVIFLQQLDQRLRLFFANIAIKILQKLLELIITLLVKKYLIIGVFSFSNSAMISTLNWLKIILN